MVTTESPSGSDLGVLSSRVVATAGTNRLLEVIRPIDTTVFGRVPLSCADDVARAAEQARKVAAAWAAIPAVARRTALSRAAQLMTGFADQFLDTIEAETGKPRSAALAELGHTVRGIRRIAEAGPRLLRTRRIGRNESSARRPHGLAAVVSDAGFPLAGPALQCTAALMAGNAVILCPATSAPFTTLLLTNLFDAARVPKDLIQVVVGPLSELGGPLVAGVDHLSYSGPPQEFSGLARDHTSRFTSLAFREPPQNGCLVLSDADPELAAAAVVSAGIGDSGVPGTAPGLVLVSRPIHQAFTEHLVGRIRRLRLASNQTWETQVGPVPTRAGFDRLLGQLDAALHSGAEILAGGEPCPEISPTFLQPTVLQGGPADGPLVDGDCGAVMITLSTQDHDMAAIERAAALTGHLRIFSARHYRLTRGMLAARSIAINPDPRQALVSHETETAERRQPAIELRQFTRSQHAGWQRRQRRNPAVPEGAERARILLAALTASAKG